MQAKTENELRVLKQNDLTIDYCFEPENKTPKQKERKNGSGGLTPHIPHTHH